VQFRLEHTFDTDLVEFERLMRADDLDAVLLEYCPSITYAEIVSTHEVDGVWHRTMRFKPAEGSYKVGPYSISTKKAEMLSHWTYNFTTRRGSFENLPNLPDWLRHRFTNRGTMTLYPDRGKLRRVVAGDIVVRFPIVGRMAERVIHKAGVSLIEEESAALARYFSRQPAVSELGSSTV